MTTPPHEESTDTHPSSRLEEENSARVTESEDELAVMPVPSPYKFEPEVTTSDSSISSSEESDSEDRCSDLLDYLYLQYIIASNNRAVSSYIPDKLEFD